MRLQRFVSIPVILVLAASAFVTLAVAPLPSRAVSAAPTLFDDFTRDTGLNVSLWQINGPVGSALGPDDVGISIIPLSPSFSSKGMEIAQINASQEVGTIESFESFTPPFTASATVVATVSNGHTFGFAISSANASSGVLVYGNVNPTNCSHLGDCGDPSTCGSSANPSIPPNQCYYGIDAKTGRGGGSWAHESKLYLTPSVNVTYTLQISVDSSGNAQFGVSQGGSVIGSSSAQVGTGPFYIIMEQGEGSPVAHPGPNQAYWMSVSVIPTETTITASTSLGPGLSSSGVPPISWLILIIVIVLFLVILLWYFRRRGFTVTVQDSRTRSAIPSASVLAEGPKSLSGVTETDGRTKFGEVKEGSYTVRASAAGYFPSAPATIKVKKKTEHTILLDQTPPSSQGGAGSGVPPAGPNPPLQAQQTQAGVVQPIQQSTASVVTQTEPAHPPPEQEGLELEGLGGPRIRQIIKTFQEKGAVSPETAMTAKELGLSRLFVRIMERRKGRTRIFVEINGKYYLDQKALQQS